MTMSNKWKARLQIAINAVVAIILIGFVVWTKWKTPSGSALYWILTIGIGSIVINFIILYTYGKRIRRERTLAER
jgi:membrane protein insertase Oxa1/YidC/SpoIIIJ